ncbi:methyltransferase family protein [Mesorhizobium australafricanum]|uniref:Isoprenylcysteine carboxylmethyltransferase family protein n=1 Tax=Mesorhizobium australafricanum TaxID=3072311 RepID=A0ABU4WWZ2_9HYPH|nr:isoprenylcysteine carboxylmethyltransferase family protein [Mesorhizobium sp. VK3E]MDX8439432.1 isoprenylcysteine carboxylmethyltransferase family protein [Mesorhizobium sp. VK3E]
MLRSSAPDAPPRSATGPWSGIAGLVAAIAAVISLRWWQQPDYVRTLAVLAVVALAMVVVDLQVYRVHLNASSGLSAAPMRPLDVKRTLHKLVGLWLTVGAVAALYWLLPVYADSFYGPFKQAALYGLPALVLLSPVYIALVDRLQRQPEDAYAELGRLITCDRPRDWSMLVAHGRGWIVKGFFLPLMFVYTNNDLAALWAGPSLVRIDNFEHFFSFGIDFLYLVDVLFAVVAYTLTLRLTDSHMRSTEPTVSGWVVCLFCYPPFWSSVGLKYLAYDQDGAYWGHFLEPYPLLYGLWGSIILALVLVYAWATVSFGLRFSNLTNRGIITNGPYRWVKHPAYLCKNIGWWMISMPFLSTMGWTTALQSCLLLAGVNSVYWLRAVTEERHLAADPAYREYQAFIARHGLWARIRRSPPASQRAA